jgi:hypothetical protein
MEDKNKMTDEAKRQKSVAQLLWGNKFFERFDTELRALHDDKDFIGEIKTLSQSLNGAEFDDASVVAEKLNEVKNKISNHFHQRYLYNQFPALKNITDQVTGQGNAKNSAYISVYYAMWILDCDNETKADYPTTWTNPPNKSGLSYDLNFRCDDGHYVRSNAERLIDNWLYGNNIVHAYESDIPNGGNFKTDFYLPRYDVYIEHWGLKDPAYEEKKKIKQSIYCKNNLKCVDIEYDDKIINEENTHNCLSAKIWRYVVI